MPLCMRTTININDKLLQSAELHAAKLHAAETNRTLTAVIEDALRLALEPKRVQALKRRVNLSAYGSGGLQLGVDLDDTSSLLVRMEGRS